jgi:chromosome segregation ATPase
VPHDKPEQINSLTADVQELESTLRILWDKSKQAADTIRSLREERKALHEQVRMLEAKIARMRTEMQNADSEMKRLMADQQSNNGGIGNLTETERDELKQKIIDLLNKINSHL